VAAVVYLAVGREAEAREFGTELIEQMKRSAEWRVLDFSFVAGPLGLADELRERLEQLPPTRLNAANLALVDRDYGRAAELFDEGGVAFAAADSRRLWGAQLASEGRHREAEEQLGQALAFYRSVGATRYIREGEALLAAAG
jgi:tetratricopeptide (TPR) repeat protein